MEQGKPYFAEALPEVEETAENFRIAAEVENGQAACGQSRMRRVLRDAGGDARDIGFDLDYDYVKPHLHQTGTRSNRRSMNFCIFTERFHDWRKKYVPPPSTRKIRYQ